MGTLFNVYRKDMEKKGRRNCGTVVSAVMEKKWGVNALFCAKAPEKR